MDAAPLTEFFAQLGNASAQASLLAVAVWATCRVLGRHLDPRWRCRLWLLVIVRLAWPFSLPSPVSLFNLLSAPTRLAGPDAVPFWLPGEVAAQAGRWVEQPWVAWTWTGVAIALSLRVAVGWLRSFWIRKAARRIDPRQVGWLAKECEDATGQEAPFAVHESAHVQSPCLVGFFRPCLLLPRGLMGELSRDELRLVFLHELAHLRRRDLALNWLLAAVESIHWFNPLVWLVTRRFRADREEACDASALAARPEERATYGETLIKLLERGAPFASVQDGTASVGILGGTENEFAPLVHRMQAIARYRPEARTWVVGSCTWLALVCVGLTDAEPRPATEAPPTVVVAETGR